MQQNMYQTVHISGTTGSIASKFMGEMCDITPVKPDGFSHDPWWIAYFIMKKLAKSGHFLQLKVFHFGGGLDESAVILSSYIK